MKSKNYAVLIYGPVGCGKTRFATTFRSLFGMDRIRDGFRLGMPLEPGTLALLTTGLRDYTMAAPCDLVLYSFDEAIRILAASELETYTVLVTMPKAIGADALRVGIEQQLATSMPLTLEQRTRVDVADDVIAYDTFANCDTWRAVVHEHQKLRNGT